VLREEKKPDVPVGISQGPAGTNLHAWIYDPRDPAHPCGEAGLFVLAAGNWRLHPAGKDGVVHVQLGEGTYSVDTVEPPGEKGRVLRRHRYEVQCDKNGRVTVQGEYPEADGVFALKLDAPLDTRVAAEFERLQKIAREPAGTFQPEAFWQLLDQSGAERGFSVDLSAGFPKVRTRLPSFGRIRALVVPVDFPDVRGESDPVGEFRSMVEATRDFYHHQSYGRVAFDFTVVPNWVRMPFNSDRYGMGAGNGKGDAGAYMARVLELTDTDIEYRAWDAVYFLVPPTMRMDQMAYGPAITFPRVTRSGVVWNGACGGADMYVNEARGVEGARWKWMAHETGHAFGLFDEDWRHQKATLGGWSVMAHCWSNQAIELGAWDRCLQGWLSGEDLRAFKIEDLREEEVEIPLSPLVAQGANPLAPKAVLVVIDPASVLVFESRRNLGFDRLESVKEGVLAYTVDMRLPTQGGGYRIRPRKGSTSKDFSDGALRPGDEIELEGVRVMVQRSASDLDVVRLKRVGAKEE
jgi:M6 family metalloprotease-like protein